MNYIKDEWIYAEIMMFLCFLFGNNKTKLFLVTQKRKVFDRWVLKSSPVKSMQIKQC